MPKRIAITVAIVAICLAEVRADVNAEFYGYWPTGGGPITIAPVSGPVATGGIEITAEPGQLTFGGSPAPFAFNIPDSLRPAA